MNNFFFHCLWCFLLAPVLSFADWSNWRGSYYNGSASDDCKYPDNFSPQKNIRWVTELDGPSASTPIVIGDRVFLSGTKMIDNKGEQGSLLAICIDRKSGETLWTKAGGSGYQPGDNDGNALQLDSRSNYSSPSPVASGEFAVFFYGNGDLVCFDHKGNLIWRRNIQEDYGDFCFQWTFSTSPTLYKEHLYLPILQRDEKVHGRGEENAKSYLLCIDLENGQTVWKKTRDTSAKKESREAFTTIIPYRGELLVAGGDFLTAHNPDNGSEIWRWGTWNPGHKQEWWRLVPSPVVGDGKILVCAPKNAPVYAIEGPRSQKDATLLWDTTSVKAITSDVPTPLFYKGYFYVLSDLRKNLSKINPDNGALIWSVDLPGKYKWRASPTAGDEKIYLMNHNAEVVVFSAKEGKLLHSVKMGEDYDDQTRSSIALSDGQLFIRTNKKLYCVE